MAEKPKELPAGLVFKPVGHRVWMRMVAASGEIGKAAASADGGALAAMFETLYNLIGGVLVSVPDDWLIPGAPVPMDWTKPEAFDWLDRAHFDELTGWLMDSDAKKKPAS